MLIHTAAPGPTAQAVQASDATPMALAPMPEYASASQQGTLLPAMPALGELPSEPRTVSIFGSSGDLAGNIDPDGTELAADV